MDIKTKTVGVIWDDDLEKIRNLWKNCDAIIDMRPDNKLYPIDVILYKVVKQEEQRKKQKPITHKIEI